MPLIFAPLSNNNNISLSVSRSCQLSRSTIKICGFVSPMVHIMPKTRGFTRSIGNRKTHGFTRSIENRKTRRFTRSTKKTHEFTR
jgi:hypothetical protein